MSIGGRTLVRGAREVVSTTSPSAAPSMPGIGGTDFFSLFFLKKAPRGKRMDRAPALLV